VRVYFSTETGSIFHACGDHNLNRLINVDPGEAEAIVLGKTIACDFLIIDDRKGRKIAVNHGLQIVGVAGILLAAKHKGLINAVKPLLKKMAGLGYRLSSGLGTEIIKLAGED
jgi:predicted nucleic acid-binding protein